MACLLFSSGALVAQSKPDLKTKTLNSNFKIYEVSPNNVKKDRLHKEKKKEIESQKEHKDYKKNTNQSEHAKAVEQKKILGRMHDNTPAIKQ